MAVSANRLELLQIADAVAREKSIDRMVVIEAAEQGRAGLRRYDEFAGPADLPDPSTTNPRHTLTASVVTRLE